VAGSAFVREAELRVGRADVRGTGAARAARAARDDALGHDAVAWRDARDSRADGLGDARPLVTKRERVAHEGRIDEAVAQLDVGAAEAAEGRADNDLPRAGLERIALQQRKAAGRLHDQRPPHAGTARDSSTCETCAAWSRTPSPI